MTETIAVEARGNTHNVPSDSTPMDIGKELRVFKQPEADPIVGASLNNRMISLRHPLQHSGNLKFLRYTHRYGHHFYRRGLSLILNLAFKRTFPDEDLHIGHSLENGYYYTVPGQDGLAKSDLDELEDQMKEIIEDDLRINVELHPPEEARDRFQAQGQKDKLRLLDNWSSNPLEVHHIGDFYDLAYFPAPGDTGTTAVFELRSHKPGFILRFPDSRNHNIIPEPIQQPRLFQIYQESKNWAKILNVSDVGALNEVIENGEVSDFIKISEAFHEKKISDLADQIHRNKDRLDVISIAGPTSSGKTTFSKRLMVQLRVNGLEAIKLSTDDYFVEREKTPLDDEGNYNFETIEALNLELFNDHLQKIIQGEAVQVPEFDFDTGSRKPGDRTIQLGEDQLLIIEGIHGLNPRLTQALPRHRKFFIYTSALTQLVIDNHNRISTSDSRLIRRIIRDMLFRSILPETNIKRWKSVRRGEEKYIFPFQEQADVMFNSALLYELAALKPYILPALSRIEEDQEAHPTAHRLRRFIGLFRTIDSREIPPTSILREFIGGSSFNY